MLGSNAKGDAHAVLGKMLLPDTQQYVVKGTVSDVKGMHLVGTWGAFRALMSLK